MVAVVASCDTHTQQGPYAQPVVQGQHLTRTFGAGDTLVTALADVSVDLFAGDIELLRGAAHRGGAMGLVVAHDERIIPHADRVFYMADGRLRRPEKMLVQARSAWSSGSAEVPALAH